MKAKIRRDKRINWRFWIKTTPIYGVVFFCLSGVAFFLDSSYWNWRLSDESCARASTRFSTSSGERADIWDEATPVRTRSSLNRRLENSALDYWNAYGTSDSNALRTIFVGLSRWGVDQATLERVENATGACEQEWNALERECWNDGADFESDYLAAQKAIDALENWGDESADVDLALDFLRELDGDDFDGASSSDQTLWAFDVPQGDPLDFAGFVTSGDFEPFAAIKTARCACDASSRLFFLLTLGGLFFSRRESPLNSAFCINSVRQELHAFVVLWILARRFVFWALREARFVFLRLFGLFFTSLRRRRIWSRSFLASTNSLSLFAVVRLNN